ncbi:tail fiber assembly protein [Aeromonas bestiarum]|uniref:Tail fiber assembly protein n=1 Tax=Aeromonas bestiarum TaxID=105751 RepID=A0AAW7I379_9GAMM|nr:tail fiber assembly protein [Aeromonas bestiarum]MDM5141749.1 tail fiber assembly protein [Aeromonas bestiarum]
MMNEPRVSWGEDGFASNDGWCFAHCIMMTTGEYSGSWDVWVSRGTGLPAGAYLDEPMQPEQGKAIVREGDAWVLVDDYRGQTAYHKQTRQPVVIDALGSLPVILTLISPSSPFDVWNDQVDGWVKDETLEDAWLIQQAQMQRQTLMGEASQEIAVLIDALDPSIISDPSDDDQVKLIAWKTYRVELSKIDQQPEYPDSINWPTKPQ